MIVSERELRNVIRDVVNEMAYIDEGFLKNLGGGLKGAYKGFKQGYNNTKNAQQSTNGNANTANGTVVGGNGNANTANGTVVGGNGNANTANGTVVGGNGANNNANGTVVGGNGVGNPQDQQRQQNRDANTAFDAQYKNYENRLLNMIDTEIEKQLKPQLKKIIVQQRPLIYKAGIRR